jgi:hypothetical protein
MATTFALWQRLDTSGHDACRLTTGGSHWELAGTAVFVHRGAPAHLAYRVAGQGGWCTRRASVSGFVGDRTVEHVIERSEGGTWTIDGTVVANVTGLEHLDLGFTPSTNVLQLRQLNLAVGQAADLPVAWMDVPPCGLRILSQRYERRGELTYWYEAPGFGYAALLELGRDGFVEHYPESWRRLAP